MKFSSLVLVVLSCVVVVLQWRLWLARRGSVLANRQLTAQIAQQEKLNAALVAENERLTTEVANLKRDLNTIEARARVELGMVKKGETFYRLVT